MASHTPGPWTFDGFETITARAADKKLHAYTIEVATINKEPDPNKEYQGTSTPDDVGEANARLIAAAPDLLALLKRIVEKGDRYEWLPGKTSQDAKKLIAQVEGS